MQTLVERSRNLAIYRGVRDATDVAHVRMLMATVVPVIASVMQLDELERIRQLLPSPWCCWAVYSSRSRSRSEDRAFDWCRVKSIPCP